MMQPSLNLRMTVVRAVQGSMHIAGLIKQAVREAAQYAPPLYAARCVPAPSYTRLTPAAPSAPCFQWLWAL